MSGGNFSHRYSVVAETRRHWSEAEKQAIVAEAARHGANVSAVARRHGMKPSLLFRWRRVAEDAKGLQGTPAFIPVTLALPAAAVKAPAADCSSTNDQPSSSAPDAARQRDDDRIEIALGNGRLVRVGAGVDTDAPRRILAVLEGR